MNHVTTAYKQCDSVHGLNMKRFTRRSQLCEWMMLLGKSGQGVFTRSRFHET